jgi:hypothetical protein
LSHDISSSNVTKCICEVGFHAWWLHSFATIFLIFMFLSPCIILRFK